MQSPPLMRCSTRTPPFFAVAAFRMLTHPSANPNPSPLSAINPLHKLPRPCRRLSLSPPLPPSSPPQLRRSSGASLCRPPPLRIRCRPSLLIRSRVRSSSSPSTSSRISLTTLTSESRQGSLPGIGGIILAPEGRGGTWNHSELYLQKVSTGRDAFGRAKNDIRVRGPSRQTMILTVHAIPKVSSPRATQESTERATTAAKPFLLGGVEGLVMLAGHFPFVDASQTTTYEAWLWVSFEEDMVHEIRGSFSAGGVHERTPL